MTPTSRLFLPLLVALLASPARAQSLGSPVQLTPQAYREVEVLIGNAVEASFLLASQPGPGDAFYHLGENSIHLTKLLVDAELPLGIPAEEPEAEGAPGEGAPAPEPTPRRLAVAPILDLRGGLFDGDRRASDLISSAPNNGVHVLVHGNSLAGGVALKVALRDWLFLEPRLTAVYSHVSAEAGRGHPYDRAVFAVQYDRTLVGWRSENLSLVPLLALKADLPLGPLTAHAVASASYLHTRTLSATTALQEVKRDSQFYRLGVVLDVPIPGFAPAGHQVYFMPAISWNHLAGDIAQVLPRDYLEVSLGVAPDLTGVLPLVGRLGASVTYVRGQGLEGLGWDVIWIVAF